MWLNDAQASAIEEKLVVKQCPLCGGGGLELNRIITILPGPPVKPGLSRGSEARLRVTCRSCGYIMEFDGAVFGVRPQSS